LGFGVSNEGITISRNFFIVSLIAFLLLLAKVKEFSFKDIPHVLHMLLPLVVVVVILPENMYLSNEVASDAAFLSFVILTTFIVYYLRIFNLLNYLYDFLMKVTRIDFYVNLFKKVFKKGDIQSMNNNYKKPLSKISYL
jgi:hypothetical protein